MLGLHENEITRFIKVWLIVILSLSYCYTISKNVTKGLKRLITVLPIVALFFLLPLHLQSVHLCGTSAFFIAWLANFKILLFAFGKGPLCCSADPSSISLPLFLAVSCLPIKVVIKNDDPSDRAKFDQNRRFKIDPVRNNRISVDPNDNSSGRILSSALNNRNDDKPDRIEFDKNRRVKIDPVRNNRISVDPDDSSSDTILSSTLTKKQQGLSSPFNYGAKFVAVAVLIKVYDYSEFLHPTLILVLYCFHIYFMLEVILATAAFLVRIAFGDLELEPQFNDPFSSTSLQDFWGRRWNLMVTSILRPTVYDPVVLVLSGCIGRKCAQLLGVVSTFLVSAVMHELMFYYLGRAKPTWEVTWFFLLHGVCLIVEIEAKKALKGRFRLPRLIAQALTTAFVLSTGFWLFFPQLMRCKLDDRAFAEYAALGEFVKRLYHMITLYVF